MAWTWVDDNPPPTPPPPTARRVNPDGSPTQVWVKFENDMRAWVIKALEQLADDAGL